MLSFFFFNDTATTEIYTLSLHDALPISHVTDRSPGIYRRSFRSARVGRPPPRSCRSTRPPAGRSADAGKSDSRLSAGGRKRDRKSTRLNSSHGYISYAVFCLKKKKKSTA